MPLVGRWMDRLLTSAYGEGTNFAINADANKGHNSILYNFLNLPKRVGTTGQYISYIYDAGGTKLAKVGTGGAVAYYAGGFVYSGSSLNYIITGEGMYLPGGGYHYYLKDHLGNTRLVVNTSGTGGTVVQQADYYPFGMDIKAYSSGAENKCRYNGKELQDDAINGKRLDWYDYGARFYDPSLGRWHTPDPSAESYYPFSPYAYCGNNPIRLSDLDGRDWWDRVQGSVRGVYDNFTGANTRASYSPTSASDYNSALTKADIVSAAAGIAMEINGGQNAVGGLVLAPETGGASLILSGVGVAEAAEGVFMTKNAVRNLMNGNNYGENTGSSTNSEGNGTKSDNKLKLNSEASGDHSSFKTDANGKITNTATYKQNPQNPSGFDEVKRVDVQGKAHFDKKTQTVVETPHVHENKIVRPTKPDDLPRQ